MFRTMIVACAITGVVCTSTVASATAKTKAAPGKAASGGCHGAGSVARNETGRRRAMKSVLCMVNRVRFSHGAGWLRASRPLASAATSHSAEMVARAFFSHVGADGAGVRRRVMRTGYIRRSRKTLVDETIAWGSGGFATPAQLVESFMQSPVHRSALLDRRYRDIGVGLLLGAPASGIPGPAATLTLNLGRR